MSRGRMLFTQKTVSFQRKPNFPNSPCPIPQFTFLLPLKNKSNTNCTREGKNELIGRVGIKFSERRLRGPPLPLLLSNVSKTFRNEELGMAGSPGRELGSPRPGV